MGKKITVELMPTDHQRKLLTDTMNRYGALCNYISEIVYETDVAKPINLYYWKVDAKYDNLYYQVRDLFPDINSNMITLALKNVPKAYVMNKPSDVLEFGDRIDYSSYLITPVFIAPPPNNTGVVSISTLAGREKMQFIFEDSKREKLEIAFSFKAYCEYKVFCSNGTFYLSRNLSGSKVKEYYRSRNQQAVSV